MASHCQGAWMSFPQGIQIPPRLDGGSPCNLSSSLVVEDITFDDTYSKGTDWLHPFEWWYFDAIFDNQYSVEFHVIIASIKGKGVVAPMLNIYHEGKLLRNSKQFLPLDAFWASVDSLAIYLSDAPFMKGYQNSQGNWIFDLSLFLDDMGVNLTYTSMTQGWKYPTYWACGGGVSSSQKHRSQEPCILAIPPSW